MSILPTDETLKLAVWNKGRHVSPEKGKYFSPSEWRIDSYGSPIRHIDYGNINSKHGWEIDHIKPTSKGGLDTITNLQPLQWENNRIKSNKIVSYRKLPPFSS